MNGWEFKKLGLRTDFIVSGLNDEEEKMLTQLILLMEQTIIRLLFKRYMKFSKEQIVQVISTLKLLMRSTLS